MTMSPFQSFIDSIPNTNNRNKFEQFLNWIHQEYPHLDRQIKWNQPMFIQNGTFIIGFSVAKNHFSVAIEKEGLDAMSDAISQTGYEMSKMLFRVKWSDEIDKGLFKKIIDFQCEEKKNYTSFWR